MELLLALGIVPYGVADTINYRLWVSEPPLPDSADHVGLREPNLELTKLNVVYGLVGRIWPFTRNAGTHCAPGSRIYLQ